MRIYTKPNVFVNTQASPHSLLQSMIFRNALQCIEAMLITTENDFESSPILINELQLRQVYYNERAQDQGPVA